MSRRNLVWSVAIIVAAAVLTAVNFARADVVAGSLLYLDAADADGNGVKGAASGTAWANKGSLSNTYDATVAAAGNGTVAWAGAGGTSNPYTLQVRPGSGIIDGGYARVNNTSTTGNSLDRTVYTYEVWAKINGNGSDTTGGLYTGGGTLIGHNNGGTGQGNGSIGYAVTADNQSLGFQANSLYTQSGAASGLAAYQYTYPNSTDLVGTGYHQVVLARAGAGATETAWYLDGVLKGTFQTASNASENSLFMIGGRHWLNSNGSDHYDMFADADISIARVYGRALTGAEVSQNFAADCGTFGLSQTPEPSTMLLGVTGIFGLLAYAWRRRK